MDITEDNRLQELKQALSSLSLQQEPPAALNSFQWTEPFDISSIPALTTIDLSALQTTSISALTASANTSLHTHVIGGGGGGGGSGYGYIYPSTTTGTNAIWNSSPITTTITADDVVVKGRSIVEALNRIEERLGILDCDNELEQDWQELRELGQEYRKIKQRIEDKMKTFQTLKK
jgi:hypothetical protein